MNLVVLSVVVIALLIAVLASYLFATGVLLNRVAGHLDECLQSLKMIGMQARVIGPAVMRINRTGKDLVDALPLLYGGAERLAQATAPPSVGYLDGPTPEIVEQYHPPTATPVGVGYLDA